MNKETVTIRKGDSICVITSGAGGWGNPLERDVESVRNDVRNGGVSVERAREVYGVVINEKTGEADIQATNRLRGENKPELARTTS
jgi:N-methylhydantoinase B